MTAMDDRPRRLPPTMPRPASSQRLVLDEHQLRLISLLLAGHTDVSAAHRLGVSPRTVTNMLRSLMNRLGVDNRFQLGAALGTRMWCENAPIRSDRRDRDAFA